MSEDSTPSPPAGHEDQPEARRNPARWWIAACAVLAVVAVGLGGWALSLRSDVDDKDAQIAAQQEQLEESEDLAGRAREAADRLTENAGQAIRDLGAELEQLQGTAAATQEQTQQAIEQAEQAAQDAGAQVEDAQGEVQRAQAEAEQATARADAVRACARGYLSAIAGAFDASSLSEGVEQARTEFESLGTSCEGTLGR